VDKAKNVKQIIFMLFDLFTAVCLYRMLQLWYRVS